MASIQEEALAMASEGRTADADERVTPLELFFDLVFVFAVTQVTQVIADEPDWHGLAKGLVLLSLIWWAWAAYAWLTNAVDTARDGVRLVLFGAMIAMFVVALTMPRAFDDRALLFGLAYATVRMAHVVLFGVGTREASVKQAARALAPSVTLASALVLGASLLDGAAQGAVFVVAVVIDYAGGGRGIERWTLHPGYFAERHGLVVILAFGESIVATGIGAQATPLGAGEVAAAALAIALAAALWWAYFDVVALVAERRLRQAEPGLEQNSMARDSYSYIHLALIAGIVLVALGSKKAIGHVGEPLELVPAVCLCGGITLYLLGQVAFRLRNIGSVNRQRVVVAAAAAALIPVAVQVDALVTLALTAALCAGLIAYEAVRFGETRRRVRAVA